MAKKKGVWSSGSKNQAWFKSCKSVRLWWLTPIILSTWEVEIGRIKGI
jgi:hypothetical protein